jgi:adenylylsulfate kinase-like enzyme
MGTIFITGISASGKSTLGKRLREMLVSSGVENVKLLDGEGIRQRLSQEGKQYGYTLQGRSKLALEIARMALESNRQGFICIICSICHVKATREKMRKIVGHLMEVHLNCAVSVCAQRDYKGNYAKAFQGLYEDFIGVTEPYQESDSVELVLNTDRYTIEECSRALFDTALTFLQN